MVLAGNELLYVQGISANGMVSGQTFPTTTQAIANLAGGGNLTTVITALNTVGAGTITAAGIAGKIVQRGGSQSGTAFTDTTDTAAAIIALLPTGAQGVGDAFSFTYQNLTNAVATLAHGTGVTITGEATIPANGYAKYLLTIGASSTITMVQYENGGFSADATDPTKVIGFEPSGQTTATTALIATVNTANATYTLPPSTGSIAATSGANLFIADVSKCSTTVNPASTALSTVTGLSGQTLVAGATYRFRCVLPGLADGTSGQKYAFTYTTATLTSIEATGIGYTVSAVAVQHTTTTTNSTLLFDQAAALVMVILEGTMVVNAGGTVALQTGTHTGTTAGATYVGATMEFVRIA